MRVKASVGGGIFGKLIFSAFGLVFALIGTQFVKQEWKTLQDVKAMQQWAQIPCTIKTSRTEDDGQNFRLAFVYRYSVGSTDYTGTRYSTRPYLTAETIGEIKRAEKRFPPGKTVPGFYNPADPAEAVLHRPAVSAAKRAAGLTLIFPAFGLLFAGLPWLRGRRKKKAEKKNEEVSAKQFLVPFGSVFVLVGLLTLKPLLADPLVKTQDAQTWNAIRAVVVSSKVKSHRSDDSTTYSPYIAYRYVVDGTEYFGDQYTFTGGSSSGYAAKAEIVRRYPRSTEFTVFVNPDNPAESVILREPSWNLLFGLIPLVFAAAGIAVIIAGFRTQGRRAQLSQEQAGQSAAALKGKSPVVKAVGLTLFTAVWGGVIFLILKSDAPLLFPVLFGLFGIGLAAGAVYAILAVFNPRPAAEIRPGRIHPGTQAALRWRIGGSTERIRELRVVLQCLKVTTETRRSGGKSSTSVVKTPLFEQELLHSTLQHEIAQHAMPFTIPADQPASRHGSRDGIEWQLAFHGVIDRWPDLNEELPFLVYPHDAPLRSA